MGLSPVESHSVRIIENSSDGLRDSEIIFSHSVMASDLFGKFRFILIFSCLS